MNESRRQFLRTAAGATALLGGAGRAQGAAAPAAVSGRNLNSRLGVAFIGCGGRSGAHMHMLKELKAGGLPVEFVSVCDVYRPRQERAQKSLGAGHASMDYREILARPDVDLVCIATPDHWHGRQAMEALQAGKHVYCEKPVTHWRQFEVTKKLAEVAAASPCAFQLGTQGMSDPVWRQMKKLVKEGLIGQPLEAEVSFFRIGDWGEAGMHVDDANAKPGPDLDWDAFQGDAGKQPYSLDRHFKWRLFDDYAGGPVTDLYPHSLTQVVDVLGVGFPSEVVALGGTLRYHQHPLRSVPDTCNLIAQYPEKVNIVMAGTQGNDYQTTTPRGAGQGTPVIRGWDGTLTVDRNNKEIVFTPLRVSGAKAPQRIVIEGSENNTEHWKNLIACAQAGKKDTWSPMDLAYRTQTVLHMAALAARNKAVAKFDATQQRIVL